MSTETEVVTGRQRQEAAALAVRDACYDIFYCNAAPPVDVVEQLRTATETLARMSEKDTAAFSLAAVVNFYYKDEPGSYSSGHKAAGCLGIDLLEWLKEHPGGLPKEHRETLGFRVNQVGSQLQRERAVLARDDALRCRLDVLAAGVEKIRLDNLQSKG